MLTSVEALLCSQDAVADCPCGRNKHGDCILYCSSMSASSHDHVTKDYLLDHIEKHTGEVGPDPECKSAAAIRETMGRATYDLYCEDARSDQECVGVTLEDLISVSYHKLKSALF